MIVTLELLTTNLDTPLMGTINAKVLTALRTQSYKVEGSSIKGAVKGRSFETTMTLVAYVHCSVPKWFKGALF